MKLRNCDMIEFAKRVKDKQIICFGASVMLVDMLKIYDYLDIGKKIKYIIDNNPRLSSEQVEYKDYKFSIANPEKLVTENITKTVLVFTSEQFPAMLEQLDGIEALNDMEAYIYPLMDHFTDIDSPMQTSDTDYKIPKIIHYCWFGNGEMSEMHKQCINSWKKFCPDYEILQWNEKNYDVMKSSYMAEAYKRKAWAFVTDYARLDIIREYGGIYLDTDVMLYKNLDPLRKNTAYCGTIHHGVRVNTGIGFGAVKGFRMIEEWLDAYRFAHCEGDTGMLNRTLCTKYQTDVLKTHSDFKQNAKYQVVENMTIYPRDFFDPLSPILGLEKRTENTYSVHYNGMSWSNKGSDFSMTNIRSRVKQKISEYIKRIERTESRCKA